MDMIEHTGTYAQFAAACEQKMADFEPVAHLATIGANWYLFHGPGLIGYTAAMQGHAGGDRWDDKRTHSRPVTYWTTPEGIPQLQAWHLALAFITARVSENLTAEWSDVPVERPGR